MTCDLNLSEDERQVLAAATSMLEAHYPVARKRNRNLDSLTEIAGFGLLGLALADENEKSAFSVVEEALLHVLLGRHLVSTRALAASLAARLAAAVGRRELAAEIVNGDAEACVALPSSDSILLLERGAARLALIFGDSEITLVDIDGLELPAVDALGHGAPLQRAAASRLSTIARSTDEILLATADLLISAQMLGIAEAACELAVEYAKVRQQFGQPIGGFQAIKHHCANMAVAAEIASAQLDFAAITLRDGREEAAFQVAALRHLAQDAAFFNARTALQVHGGIGFSAEADVHHYLKHAHLLSRLGHFADILAMTAPLEPHLKLQEGN